MQNDFYKDFFKKSAKKRAKPTLVNQRSLVDGKVSGEVLRIVFTNSDNSYSVIKILSNSSPQQELVLVGMLAGLLEGQEIEADGRWEQHADYGWQFRVESFKCILPVTAKGIYKYLSSGVLPGIGKAYAERIVRKFGKDTLNILDNYSERLKEVPGIGKKRIADIRKSWQEQSMQRQNMIFLQGLGISPAYAVRIINRYGAASAELVKNNPYRLASEIDGIGFLTADRIATQLQIEKHSPLRLCAGIVYTLDELSNRGNVCYPQDWLIKEAAEILGVADEQAKNGLQTALDENKVQAFHSVSGTHSYTYIYLRRLKFAEDNLIESLRILLQFSVPAISVNLERLGGSYQQLNEAQWQAVHWAMQYPCTLITGGPGVGKTTVVSAIVRAGKAAGLNISLAAPTGRAAKRMSEATGFEATTIHRLLKWEVESRSFYYGEDHKLPCDMLIVDEVSMLDIFLADSLFCAINPGTRVILVGDKDQLPSVGPGTVLQDLINCRLLPVTFLTEIFRQKQGSRIIVNAHAVNQGSFPDLKSVDKNSLADFYWIEQEDPEKINSIIVRLISERIPKVFRFDPINDVQILSPMRKGNMGITALNELLQEVLNPAQELEKPEFYLANRVYRLGDKVMQTSNNYDKSVFNGEMGIISSINKDDFSVLFDQGDVNYLKAEADQLTHAYAVTVHKSQGSEFPVVIMPVLTQHFVMLQRNLIYTGMTRAKKLLIMIGTKNAMGIAVRNNAPMKRVSLLENRLRNA